MDLDGKVAVVTGAASGIGRGVSLVLADEGASIAIADLNLEGGQKVAKEVEAKGRKSVAVSLDVTEPESIAQAVAKIVEELGQIDILVNAAGVVGGPNWSANDLSSWEDWDLTFQINTRGLAKMSEAVAEHMVERKGGKIINIASVVARQGSPTVVAYSASKAGVVSITQGMALRFAPHNINVNAICPGLLWTPMWQDIARRYKSEDPSLADVSEREIFERSAGRNPMKREQTPEDIGYLAAFLASEKSRNITGQAINVDGGARAN